MAAVTTEAWSHIVFAGELADVAYQYVGAHQLPRSCLNIEAVAKNLKAHLIAHQRLQFVQDKVLNKDMRNHIALTFCICYLQCYYDIELFEVNANRVVGSQSIDELKAIYITTGHTCIEKMFTYFEWGSKARDSKRSAGIVHCFDELLLYCNPDFIATFKDAFVPPRYQEHVLAWYEHDHSSLGNE